MLASDEFPANVSRNCRRDSSNTPLQFHRLAHVQSTSPCRADVSVAGLQTRVCLRVAQPAMQLVRTCWKKTCRKVRYMRSWPYQSSPVPQCNASVQRFGLTSKYGIQRRFNSSSLLILPQE